MPAYNAEDYIEYSIQSVINQSWYDWELIIINDFSTDKTVSLVDSFDDKRIILISLKQNSGAAVSRNIGIEKARGKYLAFLDSDDLWHPDKLKIQVEFMENNDINFTCTMFSNFSNDGKLIDITKNSPTLDYEGVLKNNPGNSTVMYNAETLGKFFIPNIRKRNDFVMWLKVIKEAKVLYGIPEVLTYYRVRENSLSSNKASLLKYQWEVYYKIENLSLIKSILLIFYKIISIKFKLNRFGG